VALAIPVVYEPAIDPGLGFNLIAWSGNSGSSWTNAINALHAAGFREVSISPVRRFNNSTGQVVANSGYPSLSAIEAGVMRAKQLGMRVTLNPFVELSNLPPSAGGWRAYFAPLPGSTVANTFWPLYETYLDEVATIAQNHNVDAMNVGTEMKGLDSLFSISDFDPVAPGSQSNPTQPQLDQQKAYWTTAIDSVASIYSGAIGYAANWDNFSSSRVTNNIWSHPEIDYIGIDSYFRFESGTYQIPVSASDPLQTYPNESFIQLVADEWNQRLDGQVLPFATGLGKPVVFTEQGYQHHNGTSRNPQNESGSVDTAEQIMAFEGLLRALDGRQEDFLAMHIWQWEMTGSQGSTWNINPSASANQPDNRPLAQWLSGWVSNLLPGDFNRDGGVDAADYVVWRKSAGQSVTYFSGADGNGSGVVDATDYNVWRSRFGISASGATILATIPEPGATQLILLGLCGKITIQNRRRLAQARHKNLA
jgi:type II secretory pathway pseudopilin PulG